MINRELKNKAFELRKSGKSYNYISNNLSITKGTLSYWFNNSSWSKEIEINNREKIKEASRARIINLNERRLEKRQKIIEDALKEADLEFVTYKNNTLFIGALMLYLGEGDKSKNSHLRLGNIDPTVISVFINFLSQFCSIEKDKIRFWLLYYPDNDLESCLTWWQKNTHISRQHFYKSQLIQGRHKKKRLLYGVGNITISKFLLKIKVLRWIELASKHLKNI